MRSFPQYADAAEAHQLVSEDNGDEKRSLLMSISKVAEFTDK